MHFILFLTSISVAIPVRSNGNVDALSRNFDRLRDDYNTLASQLSSIQGANQNDNVRLNDIQTRIQELDRDARDISDDLRLLQGGVQANRGLGGVGLGVPGVGLGIPQVGVPQIGVPQIGVPQVGVPGVGVQTQTGLGLDNGIAVGGPVIQPQIAAPVGQIDPNAQVVGV